MAEEIKNLGRIVLESVNESVSERLGRPEKKKSDELNNVPIE